MSHIDDPAMPVHDLNSPPPPSTGSTSRAWWSGAGGAAMALSFGEFIARFSEALESLVVGVGNLLIDLTPGNVVATSINNIGSWQKPILIVGIIVGSIAVGGWLGTKHLSNRKAIPYGFGFFGLFGAFATARDALTNAPASIAVALLSAIVGALVALYLIKGAEAPAAAPIATPGQPLSQTADRRHVLAFGGVAAGAVALTAASRIGRTSAAERAREQILAQGTTSASPTTTLPGAGTTPPAIPTALRLVRSTTSLA